MKLTEGVEWGVDEGLTQNKNVCLEEKWRNKNNNVYDYMHDSVHIYMTLVYAHCPSLDGLYMHCNHCLCTAPFLYFLKIWY